MQIEPSRDPEHYSIFGEAWWLDATAGPHGWDEVRIESGGNLEARLPFVPRTKYGVVSLGMPKLTQHLGIWLAPLSGKYSTQLARQMDLMEATIAMLPRNHAFQQTFHHSIGNWLPWYWNGYQQSTRYTYVLDDLEDEAALWAGLQPSVRREIRKARDRYELRIRDDLGVDVLVATCNKTFHRQGLKGLDQAYVSRIIEACLARDCCRTLFAVDASGAVHAATLVVWDSRTAYYLLGGGDPNLRTSGAQSLLMWEGIQQASKVSKTFDFEGSMIEPVERFFRAFGSMQTTYHYIWGSDRKMINAAQHARNAIRSLSRPLRSR